MGLGEVKERFQTSTGPDGKAWPPLGFPRPEGGSMVLLNHGVLRASYTSEHGYNFWRVGTNLEKARILHFGGTIVPVRAGALTIPLTREAIYAGSARAMKGLVLRRGYLVESRTDEHGKPIEVRHWKLVRKVTIPARPQVGVSDALLKKWTALLVFYIQTGRLS